MEREMARATTLERENLEAHVDLCEQRYNNLELRLSKIETKVEHIHADITNGNKSMVKVTVPVAPAAIAPFGTATEGVGTFTPVVEFVPVTETVTDRSLFTVKEPADSFLTSTSN